MNKDPATVLNLYNHFKDCKVQHGNHIWPFLCRFGPLGF